MKVLAIVESAHRATLEEQDDTVVWFHHALRGAGADVALLLRGAAVGYGVRGQDASGLAFGDERQTNPPRLAEDVAKLVAKGVAVYVLDDDLGERGIRREELIDGLEPIARGALPGLVERFDQVWHW